MNYLAHALPFLEEPACAAGVAVPDWLGLTRPRLRCRARHAAPYVVDDDAFTAAVASGVVRHHADDDWFHQTPAFGDVSLELARRVRAATGDADGMRPGFLGHILVELLLDATLMAQDPLLLDRYYGALSQVSSRGVAGAVARMTGADASQLASIIERFVAVKFLYDYVDDDRLLWRLNQVMARVGLPALPARLASILPQARLLVADRSADLLTPSKTPVVLA